MRASASEDWCGESCLSWRTLMRFHHAYRPYCTFHHSIVTASLQQYKSFVVCFTHLSEVFHVKQAFQYGMWTNGLVKGHSHSQECKGRHTTHRDWSGRATWQPSPASDGVSDGTWQHCTPPFQTRNSNSKLVKKSSPTSLPFQLVHKCPLCDFWTPVCELHLEPTKGRLIQAEHTIQDQTQSVAK